MNTLIDPAQSTLLIIDLQERLLPAIDGHAEVLDNATRLLRGAESLSIATCATEQLPARLGPTAAPIKAQLRGPLLEKSRFGAATDPQLIDALGGRREVILLGTETHVCVLQSALQLLQQGYTVRVVRDACGSRTAANKAAGLERMQRAGASLVTTEMVLFEWLGDAEHPRFRDLLALIK